MHFLRAVFAALVVASVIAGCRKSDSATPTASTAAPAAAAAKVEEKKATGAVPEPVKKLEGRWVRSDGGYILELRDAELSGVIRATYFNPERPRPINVSRSIWMQGSEGLQVVVELNDQGYPGATYVLSHDASNDRLVGKYNQPAMQQSFDIDFVRHKGPLR